MNRSRAASGMIAAGMIAMAPLAGCATREPPPPTDDPAVTAAPPEAPPPVDAAHAPPPYVQPASELTPPPFGRPPRFRNVYDVRDLPPPAPPTPVFQPAQQPAEPQAASPAEPQPAGGLREVFPNIRIDVAARTVEFDGAVAWDVHDPDTPMTFLELVVCTPDTKEYESLVVSSARPSNVHAALLLLGLEPGRPGSYVWENEQIRPVDPEGPPLTVTFIVNPGTPEETSVDPLTWIVNAADGQTFAAREAAEGGAGWRFAGSRIVRRDVGRGEQDFYLADGDDGALVGLTTFGSETIAWRRTISPDSSIDEPEWIANVRAMPRLGTPVTVRVQAAAEPPAPAQPRPADPAARR